MPVMLATRVVRSAVLLSILHAATAESGHSQQCMGVRPSKPTPEVRMAAKTFVDKALRDHKVVRMPFNRARDTDCLLQQSPGVTRNARFCR